MLTTRRIRAQPRAETYDEARLLGLSEAIRQLDRALVQRVSDAGLLKGETLADLAKSGAGKICVLVYQTNTHLN